MEPSEAEEADDNDNLSLLEDIIANSGEVLHPKPKAVLSKSKNPNFMSILRLASKGYDTVHYTVKGGKPVEFDLSDQSEKKTLCKLIEKI